VIRVAVLVCVAALAVGVAAAAAASTPRLVLHSGTHVQVNGAGFAASERITLLANGKKLWRHVVVANGRGTFAIQLPLAFRLSKCDAFVISATGSRGHRAFAGMAGAGCEPGQGVITPTP
jgi:ABC-type sugar transport system substrate-binding protein